MIQEYLEAGMHLARYELLSGDEGFYAEIDGIQGVWANAQTLEECRDELYSAFEEWVLLSIRLGDELPVLNGIELSVPEINPSALVA
jgi:predicted RNase H-like HicB family nuclease